MTDTNGWLPEGYKEPVTSNYMQFEEGTNLFRILGSFKDGTAIMGLEYWKSKTVEGKVQRYPVRVNKDVQVPVDEIEINPKTNEPDLPKFFWAVPAWNYSVMKVQILEIKQKTIRKAIEDLVKNPKWGEPSTYDICVTRTLENGKTSYTVTPDPKSELEPEILKTYKAARINMEALFTGGDPFTPVDEAEKLAAEADKILNKKESEAK